MRKELAIFALALVILGSLVPTQLGALAPSSETPRDFGLIVEHLLQSQATRYFGVQHLESSATDDSFSGPGEDAVLVAKGLKVDLVSDKVARYADMIALWPDDEDPTYAFICVENFAGGPDDPSVQRVELETGKVTTVLRGMKACDPVRRTSWGTLLVAEESGADGGAYEILDPMSVIEAHVLDRATGETDNPKVVKRPALGARSWEGVVILPDGTLYSSDELRPGDYGVDHDGGAIFKFIPQTPYDPANGPVIHPADSPFASGKLYAMQIHTKKGNYRFGQGAERGGGSWVEVNPATSRADANAKGATGFYRPEDMELDTAYDSEGVRFCWANTGRHKNDNWGEVLCAVDEQPSNPASRVVVSQFVQGNVELNQPDNLAFQPTTGILYVIEDNPHGDVWACLPDGADLDDSSDGCIRILSIRDPKAEPTGFIFTEDGETAYLNIQHRTTEGHDATYDDMVKITGWKNIKNHE